MIRFLGFIFQLVIAYYLGRYITDAIFARSYFIIILLCIGFLYTFFLSWEKKMLLFSLMIFFPLAFDVSFLPISFIRDIVAPILSFLFLLELLSNRQPILSKRAKVFFLAIGIFAIWSIVNYIRKPVLGQLTFGVAMEEGGLQSYYIIFVGITIFLCSFWFFRYKRLGVNRLLYLLLLTAIITGNLRVLGYFTGFTIPFLGGGFSGGGWWFERAWSVDLDREIYYAIGGLKQASMVSFSALTALLHRRRWNLLHLFCLINILILVILSGGRAPSIGIVFAIIMYVSLINRRLFLPLFLGFLLIICTYMIFFQGVDISQSKFGRIAVLSGGLKEQSTDRYYTFLYMWNVFEKSPVFGKGIGYQRATDEEFFEKYPDAEKFRRSIEEMLMTGSHGSYTSILATFGIGGIFWLLTMLCGGIYYAYKMLRESDSTEESKLALFAYMMLSMMAVALLVGYSGYDCPDVWFLAGMIAGLKVKKEERGVVDATDKQNKFQGERLLWAEE